jgi:poly-gamma-glutamate capsule biosynthesis protein CapA/YwtB (metallophosphatase superfamily)
MANAAPGLRIQDETGAQLQGAIVQRSELGRGLVRVEVSADGYYASVQTMRADAEPAPVTLVQKKPGRNLLLFAGDAMLARRYFEPRDGETALVRRHHVREDGEALLAHVRPYVQLADLASVNLETQLADAELSDPLPKLVTFWSPAALAGVLEWAGFDYVALGNNHTFDFRDAGVRSTVAALRETTLGYSGMGLDEATARLPYCARLGDDEFAFLSYVGWQGTFAPHQAAIDDKGGAALGNSDVFVEDLARLHDGTISVLQYHSGLEYAEQPALTERTSLQTAIDAGADVVVGHHAHVLQGLDLYKNRLVAYSMGNFLFDQYHYTTQMGMLLYVWMDGEEFHRAEIVPLDINGYVPMPATGSFAYAVLNRIARLSRDNGVCMQESGMHAVVDPSFTCQVDELVLPATAKPGMPVSLWQSGMSPVHAVAIPAGHLQYRAGTDLLRRGDFESANLFHSVERSWLEDEHIVLDSAPGRSNDSMLMKIELPPGATVRAGMKVFERTFRQSNPATLAGRIHSDGDVEAVFLLQRRRIDDSLSDALSNGPLTEVGRMHVAGGSWQDFSFDHSFPRLSTRSIRLLVDLRPAAANSGSTRSTTVLLDDLAWVEWHSPWLEKAQPPLLAPFATHLQVRPIP